MHGSRAFARHRAKKFAFPGRELRIRRRTQENAGFHRNPGVRRPASGRESKGDGPASGPLGRGGGEGAAESNEFSGFPKPEKPGKSPIRCGWAKGVDVHAPAALGTGHPHDAIRSASEIHHDVGDGRMAARAVGVLPEQQIAGSQVSVPAGIRGLHPPQAAGGAEGFVLRGGGAGQSGSGRAEVKPSDGVRAVHDPWSGGTRWIPRTIVGNGGQRPGGFLESQAKFRAGEWIRPSPWEPNQNQDGQQGQR